MSPQTRGYKTICDETRIIEFFANRCVSGLLYSQIVTILHDYSQKNFPTESQECNPVMGCTENLGTPHSKGRKTKSPVFIGIPEYLH